MPVVQTASFKREEAGMSLSGKYSISVDSEGKFSAVLPEDVARTLKSVGIVLERNSRSDKEGWVYADTLEGIKQQVGKVLDSYFSKELVSSEIVLKYQIGTACSYMIDEVTGEFIPNGTFRTVQDNNYQWHEGNICTTSANQRPYGLQVYVRAERKEVYRFATGATTTKYEGLTGKEYHSDLLWLMGIRSICPINGFSLPMQEIPATPDNCAFFVSLLKSIFTMNERIKDLVDPEHIQALASSKFSLLGGPK